MITKNCLRSIGMIALFIGLIVNFSAIQAQQMKLFNPNTQTLVVDLTEISELPLRSEVYDVLKSCNQIEIQDFDNATKVVLASNSFSKSELQQYYEAAVQNVVKRNEHVSAEVRKSYMAKFIEKYGFETTDHLMRSVTSTENDSCLNSLPFCTDLIYNFPAGVGNGNGENGPAYGCLGSTPNPAWYHMKIAIAGTLTIKMFSVPSRDIDFILWGPFDDPASPCVAGLTANKIIDCSYSTASIEYCDISNGVLGKYYILLITNFSNQPCNITFQKTGGTGATDCTIVPPPIGSNSPVCYGDDIHLTADDFPGATYAWSGPNGWSSSQQNPTIPNADMNDAGTYSLVITVGGSSSDPITLNVQVNANPVPVFTGENVCFGEVTHFTNTSYTQPTGYPITSRLWNFGDGTQSSAENPTHTYLTAGNFTVTLTCYTGLFNCVTAVSHLVSVNANPVPEFTAPAVCFGDPTVFTNQSSTNPPGNIITSRLWDFGDGTTSTDVNPTHTYANPGTYEVELKCYTGVQSCPDSVTHSVSLNPIPVPAFSAENVCFGSPTEFVNESTTNPPGETITGYLWDFGDGQTSTLESPSHSFGVPGTYNVSLTCYTGDHNCEQMIAHNSQVSEYADVNAGIDIDNTFGWSTTLDGTIGGGSGNLQFVWSPADKLVNPNVLNPTTISLTTSTEFTLTVTDMVSGCISTDKMWVNIIGGPLTVNASATPDNICKGESTVLFAYTSGGAGNFTYSWTSNPVGFTSDISQPTVSPIQNTTYSVSVFDGQNTINDDIFVTVRPTPIALAGGDQTINVGTFTNLSGSTVAGSGSETYLWSPADSLANPATGQFEHGPQTKILTDTINQTTFTLIINDDNGCVSEPDEVIITVGGEGLAVFATTENEVLCNGESTTITATVAGGNPNYTYSWSSEPYGFNSSQSSNSVSPHETTTYSVSVFDGFTTVSSSVQVAVNPLPTVILPNPSYNDTVTLVKVCVRDTIEMDAGANMNYLWNNGSVNRKLTALTNGLFIDIQTYSVLVTNPATGCQQSDAITIFFDFTVCGLGMDDKTDISNNFVLRPNPTKGIFKVEIDNLPEDGILGIANANGVIIEERAISLQGKDIIIESFDLSAYPDGVYLIWVSTQGYKAVKQIIKN